MGNSKTKKEKKKRREFELKKHHTIEKQLRTEQCQEDVEMKMLLLGTGDSGKSTFLKQMQFLYSGGFSFQECQTYRKAIRMGCVEYTKILLKSLGTFDLALSTENKIVKQDFLNIVKEKPHTFTQEIAQLIKTLWEDAAMKKCFLQRHKIQLPASAGYFLDRISEIADEYYKPNKNDILFCRIPTTGVKELKIEINGYTWNLVDVGGQRSERRKWVHYFDDVDILIFVIALDGYAEKLFENHLVNRMSESISVFENIVNNNYFRKKDLVILYNKTDIFKQNLTKIPIKSTFPEYKGKNTYEEGSEFFKEKFMKCIIKKNQNISSYNTCGIETDIMKNVFEEIKKSLREKYIKMVC
ncbi:guanine nucleotide-binding protein g(o) subunit alpha [Anaeramoeba flamelloides]|uniref:Guanine nucleotide-binding protein g(O) subunit alpha n=1 Tax=Anaeramoeba flamelloides TaxID=1746091 RepID=A0ABQ8Z5D2_9EUKA|nr:guanine nucleotide-binding protein g(o) subunit alpha [Anaeramoeba flamelloides]